MSIRLATSKDLLEITELRMRLFEDAAEFNGQGPDEAVRLATITYFAESIENHLSMTWVADIDGRVVSLGSLAFFNRPPFPSNLTGKEAYLFNMYTLPEHRKKGYGNAILQHAMSYARNHGITKIWLDATDDGRRLYTSAGFTPSDTYMEWEPSAGG
nr:GNAT family N-acetyltransferase [uncultured Undibacterium sp.]